VNFGKFCSVLSPDNAGRRHETCGGRGRRLGSDWSSPRYMAHSRFALAKIGVYYSLLQLILTLIRFWKNCQYLAELRLRVY